MGTWDDFLRWLRSLVGPPPLPAPDDGETQSLNPKVLLITFDPIIRSEGARSLTKVLGWGDPDSLCRDYISDIRDCSNGFVNYEIVEHLRVDSWPVKVDGYRYDEHSFLRCWTSRSDFHDPDAVDYRAIVSDFSLLTRVESGEIDEVWLFAFPYAGFYESLMIGPGALWCNSPPMNRDDGISRRFVIMGFNYERGIGPMLESIGHRFESHLKHVWRHHHGDDNLWERFIQYDKAAPGQANCGWMHYAPNSQIDYDWANTSRVRSNCDDWLNFPNLQGTTRLVDCRDWGNGDMRAHHLWWFKRLPAAPGSVSGISNNWWRYGIDPNAIL